MTVLELPEKLVLNHDDIDSDHQIFIELIDKILGADKKSFASCFNELVEHTQAHFNRENELMTQTGYKAIGEHKGEHDRVLGDLMRFKQRVDAGSFAFARAFVKDQMPEWFHTHITMMDAALVLHLKSN